MSIVQINHSSITCDSVVQRVVSVKVTAESGAKKARHTQTQNLGLKRETSFYSILIQDQNQSHDYDLLRK